MASRCASLCTPLRFLAIDRAELSLPAVLRCGQAFRWSLSAVQPTRPAEGHTLPIPLQEWSTAWSDRTVTLRQDDNGIYYIALYPPHATAAHQLDVRIDTTLDRLRHYFVLDVSLRDLYKSWSARDPVFSSKIAGGSFDGLRVCRQDPWETMIAFICSANNNIPRITSMVYKLCETYGTRMPDPCPGSTLPPTDDKTESKPELPAAAAQPVYAFPSPTALSDPAVSERLRSLGFGYRASYVASTAQTVAASDPAYLDQLSQCGYPAAHQALVKKFDGVGPKVADCICLFGLGFVHVIPVDVHLFAIAKRDYGIDVKQSKAGYEFVKARLCEIWGPWAGWAQQVLFLADLKYPPPGDQKQSVKKRKRGQTKLGTAELGEEGKVKAKPVRVKLHSSKPGCEDPADQAVGIEEERESISKGQLGPGLGTVKLPLLKRSKS